MRKGFKNFFCFNNSCHSVRTYYVSGIIHCKLVLCLKPVFFFFFFTDTVKELEFFNPVCISDADVRPAMLLMMELRITSLVSCTVSHSLYMDWNLA